MSPLAASICPGMGSRTWPLIFASVGWVVSVGISVVGRRQALVRGESSGTSLERRRCHQGLFEAGKQWLKPYLPVLSISCRELSAAAGVTALLTSPRQQQQKCQHLFVSSPHTATAVFIDIRISPKSDALAAISTISFSSRQGCSHTCRHRTSGLFISASLQDRGRSCCQSFQLGGKTLNL